MCPINILKISIKYIIISFSGIQGIAGGNSPAHMMQLTPFLYSYQLAMAQAAQAMGKRKIFHNYQI